MSNTVHRHGSTSRNKGDVYINYIWIPIRLYCFIFLYISITIFPMILEQSATINIMSVIPYCAIRKTVKHNLRILTWFKARFKYRNRKVQYSGMQVWFLIPSSLTFALPQLESSKYVVYHPVSANCPLTFLHLKPLVVCPELYLKMKPLGPLWNNRLLLATNEIKRAINHWKNNVYRATCQDYIT
jgi:hypothetical protein